MPRAAPVPHILRPDLTMTQSTPGERGGRKERGEEKGERGEGGREENGEGERRKEREGGEWRGREERGRKKERGEYR